MNADISALRAQLQQLKSLQADGSLGDEAYERAKAPLERQLLDSVMADPAAMPLSQKPPRPPTRLATLLGLAVLALAGVGYWWTGSPGAPSASTPGATRSAAATADGVVAEPSESETEQQFATAVAQLAEKLKTQPDNAEGWGMLARSYARLGRHAQAVPAYEKAISLSPKDARLLADFADTVAVQNQLSLDGRPTQLIEQALKIDPDNPKALALAGTAAFNRKDYKSAVRHWERLQGLTPTDASFLPQLQSSIAEARGLGGMPAAVAATPAKSQAQAQAQAPVPALAQAQAQAQAPALAAAATALAPAASETAAPPVAVTGTVRLSPTVAALAAPTDTVFIFARPGAGAGMPLAILRKQVKDLPLEYKLDDSLAMAPQARLSLFPQVIISARISKSGQAAPSAGDLQGRSDSVSHNARGVAVEINEVVKN